MQFVRHWRQLLPCKDEASFEMPLWKSIKHWTFVNLCKLPIKIKLQILESKKLLKIIFEFQSYSCMHVLWLRSSETKQFAGYRASMWMTSIDSCANSECGKHNRLFFAPNLNWQLSCFFDGKTLELRTVTETRWDSLSYFDYQFLHKLFEHLLTLFKFQSLPPPTNALILKCVSSKLQSFASPQHRLLKLEYVRINFKKQKPADFKITFLIRSSSESSKSFRNLIVDTKPENFTTFDWFCSLSTVLFSDMFQILSDQITTL